jgi:Circularly permutated YpsA SLOG family
VTLHAHLNPPPLSQTSAMSSKSPTNSNQPLQCIISGGQTGVDRAALDAARLYPWLRIGGWCPRGRLAEDGPIHQDYPLQETPTDDYNERTLWNVRESDATLILVPPDYKDNLIAKDGTLLTIQLASSMFKPHLVVALSNNGERNKEMEKVMGWIQEVNTQTLNIAGPRESTAPGVYQLAYAFLVELFQRYQEKV